MRSASLSGCIGLVVFDDSGKDIKSINLSQGEKINLNFAAYYNGKKLKANQDSFSMSLTEDIGVIDGNTLTITSNGGEGILTVTAGERIKEIPVKAENISIFRHFKSLGKGADKVCL